MRNLSLHPRRETPVTNSPSSGRTLFTPDAGKRCDATLINLMEKKDAISALLSSRNEKICCNMQADASMFFRLYATRQYVSVRMLQTQNKIKYQS